MSTPTQQQLDTIQTVRDAFSEWQRRDADREDFMKFLAGFEAGVRQERAELRQFLYGQGDDSANKALHMIVALRQRVDPTTTPRVNP